LFSCFASEDHFVLDIFGRILYNHYSIFFRQILAISERIYAILEFIMKAVFKTIREQIENFYIRNYNSLGGGFHFHSPIELLLVRRGEAKVWINDVEATVRENELAVVLSFEAHRFLSVSETGDYTILFISPEMSPAFMNAARHKNMNHPVVRDASTVARIADAIQMLASDGQNPIEQSGCVNVILGALLHRIVLEEVQGCSDGALPTKLFFYINEHYKEELSVDAIAQAMGYDRHHLSKSFRASFQMGIKDYINTLRLKNAVIMMQDRSNSITKCAMESGFGSMRTFYRVFAEEFGVSPREYLK
jgi:AraC-like DNA-binding protein